MNVRKKIEDFFEVWSEIVVSHRWWVLLITLAITFAVTPLIRNGWLDVSVESFLPKNDLAMVNYDNFRREFNHAPGTIVAIETSDSIFTLENLAKLKALHEHLEENLVHTQKVTSLVNVRYSRGEGDTLLIDDLYEIWPKTEAEIPAFKKLVLSNTNYVGGLVSEDGTMTNVSIDPDVFTSMGAGLEDAGNVDDLLTGFDDGAFNDNLQADELDFLQPEEEKAFAKSVIKIANQYHSEDFKIYNIGAPTMNYRMSMDVEESAKKTTGLGVLIIIILLSILFRRASGVLMPLMIVFLALIMTLALWPTLGYAFNANTQIIPTFILAVGIAGAVHILSIFFKYYDSGESKHDAIILAMKKTSVAILMTTLTTAAGLLSFLASDMVPTQTIGIFGAIGVVMALIYTLALMPSLLAILPIKRKAHLSQKKSSFLLSKIDLLIRACGNFGVTYAKPVVVGTCVLSIITVFGLMKVRFDHDPVSWYPEESELRQGFAKQDSKMDGSIDAQILLVFDKENSLHDPNVLGAIEEIEEVVKNHRYKETQANEVISILSVVKETHQSLNQNDPSYFVIPDDRESIAQELLLFENSGSEDVQDFSNSGFSTARLNLIAPWSDVLNYKNYLRELRKKIEFTLNKYQLGNVDIIFTGLVAIFGDTIFAMLEGTVTSYALAFSFVAILMILLMGDIKRGMLAFSPNVTPILMTLGLMGWAGISLNSFTSLLGCIVIGISVDDTIHFMHHFRRYAQETNDVRKAVKKTLDLCGRAITFTSIVLVGGFVVHVTGMLSVNKQFGILLSFAIVIALFANLILAPALMTLFWDFNRKDAR